MFLSCHRVDRSGKRVSNDMERTDRGEGCLAVSGHPFQRGICGEEKAFMLLLSCSICS